MLICGSSPGKEVFNAGSRLRPAYPPQGKTEAVRLVREGSRLISDVAESLGITEVGCGSGSSKPTWTLADVVSEVSSCGGPSVEKGRRSPGSDLPAA